MRLQPGVCVLVRDLGHVQVGLARPLVFEGLSGRQSSFLASLEGRGVGASRAEREEFAPLLAALRDRRLLVKAPGPGLDDAVIRLRTIDSVSFIVGAALGAAGAGALSLIDRRPAPSAPPFAPAAAGGTRAGALARAVHGAHPGIRMAGVEERATLEVIRSHGAHDPVLFRGLLASDVPHLGILSDDGGLDVGPLVIPGVTACVTCDGVSRTESDPLWPRLALQLGGAGRWAGFVAPPDVAYLAAALAIREAVAFLTGAAPSHCRWRIPLDGGRVLAVRVPPRTECGCGAACSAPGSGAGDPDPPLFDERARAA